MRAHRAGGRLFRQPQTLSQRGLLLRPDLPGHGLPAGDVSGALRHPSDLWVAGPVARDAGRSGAEDRPAPPALSRPAPSGLREYRQARVRRGRVRVTADGRPVASPFVFAEAPLRVYWEVTRACDLACRHCRAEAIPRRDPRELGTAEGRRLLDALAEFGRPGPRVVLTGGDPLKRADLWDLIEYGIGLGLRLSLAPSATPALTRAAITRLKALGIEAMSLSLDGSTAAIHDGIRRVRGCFIRTMEAALDTVAVGIPLQINSLVTAENLDDLPEVHRLVRVVGATRWSLFFLIPVGRGRVLGQVSPARCEELLHWLAEVSEESPFAITTTEAPHYRRVALQRMKAHREEVGPSALRRGFGLRDGNGIMFVSHTGEVQPSGFLPLAAGNVRAASPVRIYREARLFQDLRRADSFEGRCGRCEFRAICGGSRARAYAAAGNPLSEDPLCLYEPGRPAPSGERSIPAEDRGAA
ncbi:MAG: TIGR04053 family radical SAM/SPASM domain-containing protein [Candidatus Rokubacteria bacterium]|nr:TIGR04053 family radical SAM/SPASM domain-containing protein [Candidatus Rokubacteria bacterium]